MSHDGGEHQAALIRTVTVPQANIPKGKLPGLQVDLVDELPRRGDDNSFRLLQLAKGTSSGAICHQLLQDGEQEGGLQKQEVCHS